jgi:hypothetical protein
VGFYDPADARECRVRTRLITRTAVDPRLGTAAGGQLYSQRVIAEGQTFKASIEVPTADLAEQLGEILSRSFIAGIGTGRSRGQGWVRVEETPYLEPAWRAARERFDEFQKKLGNPMLVVTLLSDAIFVDEYFRDLTAPSLKTHLAPLRINLSDWQDLPNREKTFVSTRIVHGFDGEPLGLPRTPRLAVCAGSVFCFEPKVSSPVAPSGNGVGWIGENQGEGFGRAILWHPFHLKPEGRIGS